MKKINVNPWMMMVFLLIIMRMIRGGVSDPKAWLVTHLLMLPAILVGLSLHEFGHAFVSDKLGDPTPRSQGRVTINPIAHVDPMGLLCLIFAGFGWGVPVQINPDYYKHRRRDEALTAIAGVTMNLIIVIIATLITKLFINFASSGFLYSTAGGVIVEMLTYMIQINIVLMVFNLLPVPPLDGFNLITQIFNLGKYSWYNSLYNSGALILIMLILFNVTGTVLTPIVSNLYYASLNFIMG